MSELINRLDFQRMRDRDMVRPIPGAEGYYVSKYGYVISSKSYLNTGKIKILKPWLTKQGYEQVTIKGKNLKVHRLVAEAFLPNPENYPVINHKNEIPHDNHVDNLEWCTVAYNLNYGNAKKTKQKRVLQVDVDGQVVKVWNSIKEAAQEGYSKDAVSACMKGKKETYKGYLWLPVPDIVS